MEVLNSDKSFKTKWITVFRGENSLCLQLLACFLLKWREVIAAAVHPERSSVYHIQACNLGWTMQLHWASVSSSVNLLWPVQCPDFMILWKKRWGASKLVDRWQSKKKQYGYGTIKALQSPQSKEDNFCLWNLAHNMKAITALSNSYKTPKPAVLGKSLNLFESQLSQSPSGLSGLTPSEFMSLSWFYINHVVLFQLL